MVNPLTAVGNSEQDIISLDVFSDSVPGITQQRYTITRWLEYTYVENFLTPSDSWSFHLDGDILTGDARKILTPGSGVQLSINGSVQSTGTIECVDPTNDRGKGTTVVVSGFDLLKTMVCGGADPAWQFKESQTLYDIVSTVAGEYGWQVFNEDNSGNVTVQTGATRGLKTSAKGRILKKAQAHQLKPYPGETAWGFLSRVLQRFGVWLWPSADGSYLILGQPTFAQDPSYALQRLIGVDGGEVRGNNIISGGVKIDAAEQPSVILASGCGGGGEFEHATYRSALINPLISADISKVTARYKSAATNSSGVVFKTMPAPPGGWPFPAFNWPTAQPIYMHDDESHTQVELDTFVQREMVLRLRKLVTGKFTIEGHTLGGRPIAVDTIVDVQDDRSNFHGPMWIIGRTFKKNREGGTETQIDTILPGTLQF